MGIKKLPLTYFSDNIPKNQLLQEAALNKKSLNLYSRKHPKYAKSQI